MAFAVLAATAAPAAHATNCRGFEPVVVRSFSFDPGFNVTVEGNLDCAGGGSFTFNTFLDPNIAITVTLDDWTKFAPRLIQTRRNGDALTESFLFPADYEGSFNARITGVAHAEFDQQADNGITIGPVVHHVFSMPFDTQLVVISHAPEPSTYALMLAGLGLIGWRKATWRIRAWS